MFAYPSGDLHMGHAEAYAIGDALARYRIQRGYDVLHPVGWDSFGLPAENAAIKRDQHPAEWTYANIATQAASFRRYGTTVDWRTRLHTSDPEFYRWTQWLFLRLHARGLAYRQRAAVNWCPVDQTVLANEQVLGGRCERCDNEVTERELTQWFLRITAYADRLLDDMTRLEGRWPAPVLTMQRNWIGRSPGVTQPAPAQPPPAQPPPAQPATYRLRDWLVSRQRYWGCPIPIVHCPGCGEVPVPDDQLPVRLPDLSGPALTPRGVAPLAAARDWVEVPCPTCGTPAERDTDTMDTFVDSSWYFLRYPSPRYTDGPFDPEAVRRWLPVDQYVGGIEHATMHLLYARFVTKVLHDLGLVDFDEPFRSVLCQGQVILNGAAMSKSKGNMVDLGETLGTYGVDAVRVTMLFAGPPEDDVDWADVSPAGAVRFLGRALRLADEVTSSPSARSHSAAGSTGPSPTATGSTGPSPTATGSAHPSPTAAGDVGLRRTTHRLLQAITELVETHRLNVAVARTMDLVAAARRAAADGLGADPALREAVEAVAVVLSLFAPYVAEEMWARLGHAPGVALAGWPDADPALAAEATVVCAVQVNGKLRDRLEVPVDITEADLTALALACPAAAGRTVIRTIVRPPRLVNLVIGG
jgi:leucyl-tRNA synthetase